MDSPFAAAIISGVLSLIGVVLGALITYILAMKTLAIQRADAEALRRRDLLLEEFREVNPLGGQEKSVLSEMMRQGGRSVDLNRIAERVRASQSETGRRVYADRDGKLRVLGDPDAFYCFPAGTLVMLSDGTFRPVEDVRAGEDIRVYKISSYVVEDASVADVIVGPGKQLVVINGMISVTPGQEILTDHGYRAANELQLGWRLVSDLQRPVDIVSLELRDIDQDVYSIALNDDAGYYIKHPDMEVAVLIREATTGKRVSLPGFLSSTGTVLQTVRRRT